MRLVLSLSLALFAQAALADKDWIGFKKSTDAAVPPAIQKASKSVFRIFFPGEPFEIVDLSDPSKLEEIIAKYSKENWQLIQLTYCRIQGITKCPLSSLEVAGGGSAYVLRNANTLATNLHNFHPWVSAVIANNGVTEEKIRLQLGKLQTPFLLMDQNNQAVHSPIESLRQGGYQTKVINDNPSLFSPLVSKNTLLFRLSDYVELEFVKPFQVEPLQEAPTGETKQFYVVGFPGLTSLFAKMDAGDGDGYNQMVSTGTAKEMQLSALDGTAAARVKYLLEISAPSYVGNSGGPVLNLAGQVIGTILAGDLSKTNAEGKPAYFSQFLKAQMQDALKNTWKTGEL